MKVRVSTTFCHACHWEASGDAGEARGLRNPFAFSFLVGLTVGHVMQANEMLVDLCEEHVRDAVEAINRMKAAEEAREAQEKAEN